MVRRETELLARKATAGMRSLSAGTRQEAATCSSISPSRRHLDCGTDFKSVLQPRLADRKVRMPRLCKVLLLFAGLTLTSHQASLADERPKPPEAKKPRTDRYGDALPDGALLRIGTTRFRHGEEIDELVFSPDGKILASRGRKFSLPFYRFWDARSGKRVLQELDRFTEAARVAFSPDGRSIAIGEENGTITLHSIDKTRPVQRLLGQEGRLAQISYSPTGKRLAGVGEDSTFIVWDVATGKRLFRTRHPTNSYDFPWGVVLTADDKLVACGGERTDAYPFWRHNVACTWDVRTGKVLTAGEVPRPWIRFAAFTADGKTLFCSGHETLTVWQATPPKVLRSSRQEQPGFTAFALSSDGKRIASACREGMIQIWDTYT